MMKWEKLNLIYQSPGKLDWAKSSALQPTPLLRPDNTIRIFCGFRDQAGVSRVGYVDVSADDPTVILQVAKEPVLDIGVPGAFDDNGVVPCAIVERDDKIFLYYAGYQIMQKVRFQVFSGLAISEDNGHTFVRYQQVPILERTNDELLFRVIHSIFYDKGVWKVWYGAGNHFLQGKNKTLPVYNIRYMESPDGIQFPKQGTLAIDTAPNEFRVGRPYVIKDDSFYEMYFAAATETNPYRLAYAKSIDGMNWVRDDMKLNLHYSENDFDSEMSSYPSIVKFKQHTYLFYNGNNYGAAGIGCAKLIDD